LAVKVEQAPIDALPLGLQPYTIKPMVEKASLNRYQLNDRTPTVQIKQEPIDLEDLPIGLQPYEIKTSSREPASSPWPNKPMATVPAVQKLTRNIPSEKTRSSLATTGPPQSSNRKKLLERRIDMRKSSVPVIESEHSVSLCEDDESFIVVSSWSCNESDGA